MTAVETSLTGFVASTARGPCANSTERSCHSQPHTRPYTRRSLQTVRLSGLSPPSHMAGTRNSCLLRAFGVDGTFAQHPCWLAIHSDDPARAHSSPELSSTTPIFAQGETAMSSSPRWPSNSLISAMLAAEVPFTVAPCVRQATFSSTLKVGSRRTLLFTDDRRFIAQPW